MKASKIFIAALLWPALALAGGVVNPGGSTDVSQLDFSNVPTADTGVSGKAYQNNGVVMVSQYDPLVTSWVAKVATAGGSVTPKERQAANSFILSARTSGYLSKLLWVNIRAANYAANAVPLIATYGGNEVRTGFTAADVSATGVLNGDGATKYLDTGVVPSTAGMTPSGASLFAAIKNGTTDNAGLLFATSDGGPGLIAAWPYYTGGPRIVMFGVTATFAYASPTPGVLIYSCVSPTDLRTYRNGVQIGSTNTTSNTGAVPTSGIRVFANAPTPSTPYLSNAQLGCTGFGLGLTSSDAANLTANINTLESALGR